MDREALKSQVITLLGEIAPEADLDNLRPEIAFRDQFEMDSVDFLNFVLGLEQRFDVKIAEVDYPKYAALNGCLNLLAEQLG